MCNMCWNEGRQMRLPGWSFKAIAAVCVVSLVLCGSCASRKVQQRVDSAVTPVIAGTKGYSDPHRSRKLVDDIAKEAPDVQGFEKLIVSVAALSNEPLYKDNSAELLIDGPITYQAMLGSIERAERFIYLETFIFSDDEIGQEIREALLNKAREGVEIYVLYDSIGSADSNPQFFQSMKDAGIKVLEFHKINPLDGGNLLNANQRDHRKLMVVDGVVAYTGGVNIAATYSNSSSGSQSQKLKGVRVGAIRTLKLLAPPSMGSKRHSRIIGARKVDRSTFSATMAPLRLLPETR